MIRESKMNLEINGFSALATSNGKNADVMLRVLSESKPTPRVMMLFDGDQGGKEREAELKPLIDELKASSHRLDEKLTIEDYLPGGDELYASAVGSYVAKLLATKKNNVNANLPEDARKSLKEWRASNKNNSVAIWCEEFGKEIARLKSAPSKVGVAREYIALLEEVPVGDLDKTVTKRCVRLLEQIAKGLQIPKQVSVPQRIFAAVQ
jgi:hypothetical protein